MMMSGPLPMLAATAALGLTSSQPSASILTSIPVACVNFFVFSAHMSSSPWTKRFQRNKRSFAPFSGVTLYCCAAASVDNSAEPGPNAVPAATPAVALRKSRRLKLLMLSSLRKGCSAIDMGRADSTRSKSCDQPRAGRGVEQMGSPKIGFQSDLIAGAAGHSVSDKRSELLAVEPAIELCIGPSGLDHYDLSRQSGAIREHAMLGADAVKDLLPIHSLRAARNR